MQCPQDYKSQWTNDLNIFHNEKVFKNPHLSAPFLINEVFGTRIEIFFTKIHTVTL